MLTLFNTLTHTGPEEFVPLTSPMVSLYACGPTVYDETHLGHMRTYVNNDVLRRVLEYNNYEVRHVQCITDVGHMTSDEDEGEDKVEHGAKRKGQSVWEVAKFYEQRFFNTMDALQVLRPHVSCRATDHIEDQIALIKRLEDKGLTYRNPVGILFDTSKFPSYRDLARLNLEGQRHGERVTLDPNKRQPWDFALWITNQPNHIMQWSSPWGRGFPGWHIECSAMSMRYLGETIDIHAGGVDHIAVHHTNEIAQSEGATEKQFVRYWFHNEFLMIDRQKMSKSTGNLYTLDDVRARGFDPCALRFLFLTANYRHEMNFTWDSLAAAQNGLDRLLNRIRGWGRIPKGSVIEEYSVRFEDAINNDLNMSEALSVLWALIQSDYDNSDKLATVILFDKVLGLNLGKVLNEDWQQDTEIVHMVQLRQFYRNFKRWKEADSLRQAILERGYVVEDTNSGPRLERIDRL